VTGPGPRGADRAPSVGGSLIHRPQGQDRRVPPGRQPAEQQEGGPLPDPSIYERLIQEGIAEADGRGSAVDHLTARRLAIWLTARPQDPVFDRGLARFIQTGAISQPFKTQLRIHARSATYPDQPQASRLMEYCISRGADLGPVSENFGRACDQLDRADAMLMGLRERARTGDAVHRQASPETDDVRTIALARRDPESQTVTLVLDAATANIAMFAVAAHAGEREAHLREVERYGDSLPEGSYGRQNRQAIASREKRIAARLRAVEQAYRTAVERDAEVSSPQAARTLRSSERAADREIEME
jgi:hypothetical protein